MTKGLTASLREVPATVPALAAIVLFVVWATDQAGYPVTHWAPGGLIVLALLGLTLAIVPLHQREVSRPACRTRSWQKGAICFCCPVSRVWSWAGDGLTLSLSVGSRA